MNTKLQPLVELRLEADAVGSLRRSARAAYPEEACGILLGRFETGGRTTVSQVVMTPNRAAEGERRHRYEIDPTLLLYWDRIAQKGGLAVVGFFHSHPNAEPKPSRTDADLAWPGYAYVIVGITRSSASEDLFVNGMAAWTFDDSSARFVELSVTVDVVDDQIEYVI